MSLKHRDAIIEEIEKESPSLKRKPLKDLDLCLIAGSWDLTSYSFQCGFEAMWDLAKADRRGLLDMPLLTLWRQSIELTLKSAIYYIESGAEKQIGHNLSNLYNKLLKLSTEAGLLNEGHLTQEIKAMVDHIQSFDNFATRFRYPADKKGNPYVGISIDLEDLFRSHWIIVNWCEGTVVELREEFGIGEP